MEVKIFRLFCVIYVIVFFNNVEFFLLYVINWLFNCLFFDSIVGGGKGWIVNSLFSYGEIGFFCLIDL